MPPASTATVKPSAASAARCAAPSMPYAPPDTTATSRSARPAAKSAATCSPYAGARSGSDDRGGTLGHVVEAGRADHPQGQRRMSLRPQLTVHACERRERQQGHSSSPAATRRPPWRSSTSRSSAAQSIPRRASVRRARSSVTSPALTRSAASTGPTRPTKAVSSGQGGSATRDKYANASRVVVAHCDTVGLPETERSVHFVDSWCRSAAQISERPRDAQSAIHSADAEHSAIKRGSQRRHHVGVQPEPAPQQRHR